MIDHESVAAFLVLDQRSIGFGIKDPIRHAIPNPRHGPVGHRNDRNVLREIGERSQAEIPAGMFCNAPGAAGPSRANPSL